MKSGKYILFLLGATAALHCAAAPAAPAPQRPSLAVNIVLSGIPYDFFSRYEANLTEDGFRKFIVYLSGNPVLYLCRRGF